MTRVRGLLVLIIAALLVVVGLRAFQYWRGEERIIAARLDALAETLSPPAGTSGEMAMLGRIVQLRKHFAPDVHLRFGTQEIVSRDALLGLLGSWQPPGPGFSIEFVDVAVTLEDPSTALVALTAKVSSRAAEAGDPIVDAREATVTMKKLDGEWVVAGVESTETLQRP